MQKPRQYTAIGLMSGTSLDGVDAALLDTDGHGFVQPRGFVTIPYSQPLREQLRACFGQRTPDAPHIRQAEAAMTRAHADAIAALLAQTGVAAAEVDLIGFHGQTIFHAPDAGLTVQIGDGDLLAAATGIDVIDDFRSADVRAGGQGAPLAPLYHRARLMSSGCPLPAVILNIGGVANVTWIGRGEDDIIAFDTGPGNALMDDWAKTRTGQDFDRDGALAAAGQPVDSLLRDWFAHPYFAQTPPKSLDRNEWDIAAFGEAASAMGALSTEDGAATLLAFTVETIVGAQAHMPEKPRGWYACGGGRHNVALMRALHDRLDGVEMVEALGWDGDATEAECFAYLAVRSLLGLPLSLPGTTGVPLPLTGGRLCRKKAA